jgi:hypothetical protein
MRQDISPPGTTRKSGVHESCKNLISSSVPTSCGSATRFVCQTSEVLQVPVSHRAPMSTGSPVFERSKSPKLSFKKKVQNSQVSAMACIGWCHFHFQGPLPAAVLAVAEAKSTGQSTMAPTPTAEQRHDCASTTAVLNRRSVLLQSRHGFHSSLHPARHRLHPLLDRDADKELHMIPPRFPAPSSP